MYSKRKVYIWSKSNIHQNKQSMKVQFSWIALMLSMASYGQRTQELSYQEVLIRTSGIGKITTPSIFEFGAGYRGEGGFHPSFVLSLGFIDFDYRDSINAEVDYKSLTLGGTLGFRPLANIFCWRLQPVIQLNFKRTLNLSTTNDAGQEEQLFSNGTTKIYYQPSFTIASFGVGGEFFISNNWTATAILSRDMVWMNENGRGGTSIGLKIRRYIGI